MEHPAEFLYENLCIQNNVIHQAHLWRSRKLLFLASSCMYPRDCPQPMKEEHLLTGSLEPTNEGYAIAKIAGLKMVEYYRRQYGFDGLTLIPCNLYGTNDSFDPVNAHVLSALVKKFVDAVEDRRDRVVLWGSGTARREFLHVDDAARAVVSLMEHDPPMRSINIGRGEDISIRELAALIARFTGFRGEVAWDGSRPDGMPRKCLDVSLLKSTGFEPEIDLENGIRKTIAEYRKRNDITRGDR
jgi:GDP-L-fucose synthase